MPARAPFPFRLIPALAAAAGIALALAAASWQLNRAHEKEARGERLAVLAKDPPVTLGTAEARAADLEWRRVTARGRFLPEFGVLVDNRTYRGAAGYHVVMPLAIEGGGRHVLVNRGWVAGGNDRSRLPEVKTPAATIEVTGLAVVPSRRFLELAEGAVQGRVWQNLTLQRFREAYPALALQPVMIQQESALEDGLVREWAPPDLGVDKHYGYAFQWLALAATILVFYFVTHARRRRAS